MMHFTVRELELSKYKSITTNTEVSGGTRPRLTLTHKDNNQKFFFKTYSHNSREVWAECLASHIADLLGLKAQAVTIKIAPELIVNQLMKMFPMQVTKDWKPIGTLARNIFPANIETTYGAAIVESPTKPLTLAVVEEKIKSKYYAAEDLLQAYSDMVIFDALIGNMDRHHENWGVCEDKRYKQLLLFDKKRTTNLRYFTPLFDHGSSLMFELSDTNVTEYLADETKLNAYVKNSKFGFILDTKGNKNNMFDIINQHITEKTTWRPRIKKSLQRVKELDLLAVAGLVIQMPSLEMLDYNSNRRTLLYKSLLMRYNKLNELLEKG